ncbi:MAG: tryptophan synthase subunit alpha [Spirochaetes bacterium]|nr:tryptophan synthase subunit alpha [Spirochaetota bacterium]
MNINSKKALMTHIVLGYPDLKTNRELIKVMSDTGVDYIEMQIPFTDPIADGPTIVNANQKALLQKISLADCIAFAEEMTASYRNIKFLFMSYYNILFSSGVEPFVKKARDANLYGLIIPDIPFEEDKEDLFATCKRYGLNAVYVISPTTREARLKQIRDVASGFVYCTSRIGITGADKNPHAKLEQYVRRAKKILDAPIAVGFGIDSAAKAKAIAHFADIIVIGSKVINLVNESGSSFQEPVFDFLYGIKKAISACQQ